MEEGGGTLRVFVEGVGGAGVDADGGVDEADWGREVSNFVHKIRWILKNL